MDNKILKMRQYYKGITLKPNVVNVHINKNRQKHLENTTIISHKNINITKFLNIKTLWAHTE